jgi:hypothetical protein
MEPTKQFKTQQLRVVLQTTEIAVPGADGRHWEVHDVERNRGFRVSVPSKALKSGGATGFTDQQIETAVGLAIEEALLTPPEKVPGGMYDVTVTVDQLRTAAAGK